MNSKLLTVTVALTQLLIENLDKLEQHGIYRHKIKQSGNQFRTLLLKENEKLFKDLTGHAQHVFFQEIKTLETIINEYQNGNLEVIEESELNRINNLKKLA